LFTLQKQISKSIWSAIIGTIPFVILKFMSRPSYSIYKEYNKMIIENNGVIEENFIDKKMRLRYIIVITLSSIISLLSWYYVTVFCSVYPNSSMNWIYGGFVTIFLNWIIIKPSICLIVSIFRSLAFYYRRGYIFN
jgi:hypothetical protein